MASIGLDEGESIEITYRVMVTGNPAYFQSVLPNDVDLTWTSTPGVTPDERGGDPTSDDPNNPNDYDVDDRETVEVHQPDLRIEKTDFGQQIRAGQNFNYTMIVNNQGRATALDVSVSDDIAQFLREGFTFVGGTHGAGLAGTTVNFNLPDIPVGGTVNVTLTLRAPAAIPAGLELLRNTAVVDHLDVEPSPDDNIDDEDTPINAVPDLVVTKDDGLLTAKVGDEVTYTITYDNVGTQIASGVFVRDTLPPGVEFISASDGDASSMVSLCGTSVNWLRVTTEPSPSP